MRLANVMNPLKPGKSRKSLRAEAADILIQNGEIGLVVTNSGELEGICCEGYAYIGLYLLRVIEYLPAILPHKAKVAHHNPKPTVEDKTSLGDQEHNQANSWRVTLRQFTIQRTIFYSKP